MKRFLILIFFGVTCMSYGQPLRDINYKYLYNPEEKFSFYLRPVKLADNWKVFYSLKSATSGEPLPEFTVQWETREAISDKQGIPFSGDNQEVKTTNEYYGVITMPKSGAPAILVAKVIDTQVKSAWIFYVHLAPNYPVNNYLIGKNQPVYKPFVSTAEEYSLGDRSSPLVVSYYNDIFPAAAPAFSEAQAKVSKGMKVDSVFLIDAGSATFTRNGLYLIQSDTLSAEGLAFRVQDDYPRYGKVQNLAGPLSYICTKQEYDRLELAKGDKKTFDRLVLGITNDTERAKQLIRSYFKRVELANQYFTSYKEGWKTDRGMIYIVFGVPDEVFRFNDREVWNYDNDSFKASFNFTRSPSVFDPENYVLIREKKYEITLYEVIDLWRNARF